MPPLALWKFCHKYNILLNIIDAFTVITYVIVLNHFALTYDTDLKLKTSCLQQNDKRFVKEVLTATNVTLRFQVKDKLKSLSNVFRKTIARAKDSFANVTKIQI